MLARITMTVVNALCFAGGATLFNTVPSFGAMLLGFCIMTLFAIIQVFIILDVVEQKVNGTSTYSGGPLPKGSIVIDSMSSLEAHMHRQASGHDDYPLSQAQILEFPMSDFERHKMLNTPDPHLIHPDDKD